MYTPFSEDNIQIDQRDAVRDQAINEQLNVREAQRQDFEEGVKQQSAADMKAVQGKMDPQTGKLKSPHEALDPKQFGAGENTQEAVNALGSGIVGSINSVLGLPKFLDPKFYQKGDNYKPPFIQFDKPITRTVWGNAISAMTEFAALALTTRRAAGMSSRALASKGAVGAAVAKPLKFLGGERTSLAGRLGQSAASGAIGDVVSNRSHESNLAEELIKIKPEWSNILQPIATNDNMSPAQRAAYNTFEGLGLAPLLDGALEAAGAGLRAVRGASRGAATADPELRSIARDSHLEALQKQEQTQYQALTARLEREAKKRLEMSQHRSEKKQLLTDETFSEWQVRTRKAGTSPWAKLDDAKKQELMLAEAKKREIDWGPDRDYELRATRQANQETEVAMDRIDADDVEFDDAFVYDGASVERGHGLSAELDPMAALRDRVRINKDLSQAEGTPRSTLTEAQIRRMEVGAPGMTVMEADKLAKFYAAEPDFQKTYGKGAASQIKDDLLDAQVRVNEFLDDSGHYRQSPVSDEEIIDFLGTFGSESDLRGPRFGGNIAEGREIFNTSQLMAHDVLVGTLLKQVRDIARGAQSVSDHIDVLDKDSLGDMIFSRIATLARLRKETSMLNSYNLRMMGAGKKPNAAKDMDFMTQLTEASDAAASQVDVIKQALRGDTTDSLLNSYLQFLASGGDKVSSFKDLEAFFKRKLHGYTDASGQEKAAIVKELQSMYTHSILSGPRTPVRAFTGTAISTLMRPVATIIGSSGDYLKGEDMTTRSAFAGLNAMAQGVGEAWTLAKARWSGQFVPDMPTMKSIADTVEFNRQSDLEWEAMGNYFRQHGQWSDQASYGIADMMRKINTFPLFNWSTRAMAAGDQFFGHLLARARVRQLAFNDAYLTLKEQKGTVSDNDIKQLIQLTESNFEREVWAADGQITDTMLKRAQEEVSLTQDLKGWAADFERAVDRAPFLKPFILFVRTSYNALELVSKHTPLLNRKLEEVQDIRNLAWDDPKMITYGIKSPEDHAAMKALVEGRVALGYATVFTASTLFMNGMLTGNGPSDKELKASWMQLGWKPRSLRMNIPGIGEKYVSYEALEPFNTFLSAVADVGDASLEMGDDWTMKRLGQLGYIIGANVTNKSFLTGITQLNDFLQLQGNKPAGIVANIANNTVPWGGMRNELGKLFSPGMRELDNGIKDSIRNRNLYADLAAGPDGKLPYKYDVLDGKRINDYNWMHRAYNMLSPFPMHLAPTATRDLFFRSGIDAKVTFNTGPNGEVLTPAMKSKYQELIGQQNLEAQLTEEFKNPQMLQSILQMEADRAANRPYSVDETLHGARISSLINQAKKTAWSQLQVSEDKVGNLVRQTAVRQLSTKARKAGNNDRANQLLEMTNK